MAFTRRQALVFAGAGVVGTVVRRATPGRAETATRAPASAVDLGPPQAAGARVPPGFTVRVVATTGEQVGATGHVWHAAPDGGACFTAPDGGWVYVSNAEVDSAGGGASAIHFDFAGRIVDAYPILTGSSHNCSGGATRRGTWLSCEEREGGLVYECDPLVARSGVARPALGRFWHEAVAEDPATGHLYLTEDRPDGRLYRFVPARAGLLTAGGLQAASVSGGRITWVEVAADRPERSVATTPWNGGEGIVIDGRSMLVTTKGDDRVWHVGLDNGEVGVLYDGRANPSILSGVDQIVVHPVSRDLYVAEDGGDMQLVRIAVAGGNGDGSQSPIVQFDGHDSSEITGPAFTPDGSRLYVTSQRGTDGHTGVTIEISGPFEHWPELATVSGRWPADRVDDATPVP